MSATRSRWSTSADLRVSAAGEPAERRPTATTFSATDTSANGGNATAAASTTRYLLSKNATKGPGTCCSAGLGRCPSSPPGRPSRGTVTVTIPTGTPAGTYCLLACADDRRVVAESNETNNCRASTTTVKVT